MAEKTQPRESSRDTLYMVSPEVTTTLYVVYQNCAGGGTPPRFIRKATMQCFYPVKLSDTLTVPCGSCTACRIKRGMEWTLRIMHETEAWDDNTFLTLTYNPSNLPADNSLSKQELQNYFKRLRRAIEPRKIKYFACGEYGELNGRPHYHAIVFGLNGFKDRHIMQAAWEKGFSFTGSVTWDSARYVSDYINKSLSHHAKQETDQTQLPFKIVSSGLGLKWALENQELLKTQGFITQRGNVVSIPRYYVNKLEIDTEPLKKEARKDALALNTYYHNKAINGKRRQIAKLDRKIQQEKNLEARLNLKKKGKL